MEELKQALKEIYLSPLKEEPELFIGVELEFPIVSLDRKGTLISVSKELLVYLSQTAEFMVEKSDESGYPVQLCHQPTGDVLLFEVSYNILEFAFAKAKTINEIAERLDSYLSLIQPFLAGRCHTLQGCGIHPTWDKNDNTPVQLPRYKMLMDYLALGSHYDCHSFDDYGAFICGNQVQLDVSRQNFLRVLNAFNQIEPGKAYLFANSVFPAAPWETKIARDYLWEKSMHGLIVENVGVFPFDFQTEDDFLTYLTKTAMFTVTRDRETYFFPPQRLVDYVKTDQVHVYEGTGRSLMLEPLVTDLATHRAYHYQLLTRRGTVECRSVCAQPLSQTFAPTAFHLGLLEQLADLEVYLSRSEFFITYGRHYPKLRKQFGKITLNPQEEQAIKCFVKDLLQLAKQGLISRGYGEEIYLEPLFAAQHISNR